MKRLILVAMVVLLTGCFAEVQYDNPNGAKIKYTRIGDQKIEGLVVITPDGTHVELNKQESTGEAIISVVEVLKPFLAVPK